MSVVTKGGDKGETSLADGSRRPKDDSHLEAYGTVDELNSWVGWVRSQLPPKHDLAAALVRIQQDCFIIGSHLSLPSTAPAAQREKLPKLSDLHLQELENEIQIWEKKLPALKNFILPSGTNVASALHVARAVSRRAERHVVHLLRETTASAWEPCVIYLNRLSDWFFTAARFANHQAGTSEDPWISKK